MSDQLDADEPPDEVPGSDASDEERELARELVVLLSSGRKIEAVKRYREATGASLSESVAFVNRISKEHGIAQPSGCSASGVLLFALLSWWWLQ